MQGGDVIATHLAGTVQSRFVPVSRSPSAGGTCLNSERGPGVPVLPWWRVEH